MAVPVAVPDRQPSPGITLASNNPFRNRAASPALLAPALRPARPLSTNPFLDDPMAKPDHASFSKLSLAGENVPPRPPQLRRPSNHESRRNAPARTGQLIDVFADPDARRDRDRDRRPRRNSESSLMERPKPAADDDERRRRERRHRHDKSRSRRQNTKLDIIDKLDVTGIYGPGFHHDGPFDACNPHRNRKGSRTAPMQAFPKDSRNMALGGAGPNNKTLDLNQIHGRGEEGYADFSAGATQPTTSTLAASSAAAFNPTSQIEPVHSNTASMGLGTSTFLEGTPASRAAIQRNESESDHAALTRKKSLAQKIRGIKGDRDRDRDRRGSEVADNPPRYAPPPPPRVGRTNSSNNNPFGDYDDAYEMKAARIQSSQVEDEGGSRPRATSSPRRKDSSDALPSPTVEEKPAGSGGFISRVKSLRKPRK